MGKYDKVIGKLKAEPLQSEPKFREKVDARKREIVEAETKLLGVVKPGALALRYASVEKQVDLNRESASELSVEELALEELLSTVFEEDGLTELKVSTPWGAVMAVGVSNEPTTAVVDQERLVAWLKENGYEKLLTIHANTAGSLAKDILLEGGETKVNDDGDVTVMGGSMRLRQRRKVSLRKG